MTYVDLLTYLTDVQKIEKEELAELLAIPKKHIDGVLCGQVPLKKKWLKNLSLYTGIPEDAIQTGNFSLETPAQTEEEQGEGEEAPVVEATPEMEENLKNYNYDKLMYFCKGGYKKRYRDIKQAFVIQMIFPILSLVFSVAVAVLVFMNSPMTNIWLFPLTCFIPVLLSLVPVRGLFKIANSGSKNEEKTFKTYSLISLIPMLIHSIAGVCFDIFPVWALGFTFASFLIPIYFVFIKGFEKRVSDLQVSSGIFFSFLITVGFGGSILTGDFLERNIDNPVTVIVMIAILVAWSVSALTLCYVNYFYNCYNKIRNVSKYFAPLPEKTLFKKHHLRNKLIAIVLAAIILICGTYILSCAMIYVNVDSVINYEGYSAPEYSEYDKQDITFTEEDEVVTLDYEYFTFKIPADLKKNEKITTQDSYNSDPMGGIVMIYTEGNIWGESLSKLYYSEDADEKQNELMGELKQEIVDTYGFYPQSPYELKQIIKEIREDGVSFFDRKQGAAVISLLIFDTTLNYADEEIFFEDSEKELVLSVRRTELSDSGNTSFLCQVEGNKKGDYESFVNITIMLRSDYSDEDLAYKIINSIEMK